MTGRELSDSNCRFVRQPHERARRFGFSSRSRIFGSQHRRSQGSYPDPGGQTCLQGEDMPPVAVLAGLTGE
jgi:hypothetical protein